MDTATAMGLPPGVMFVRLGNVQAEELHFQDGVVMNGPRPGPAIVVRLAPGWELVYDIHTDRTVPAQVFNPPQEVVLQLRASNSLQLSDIMALRERLKQKGVIAEDEAEVAGQSNAEPSQPAPELNGAEPPAVRPPDSPPGSPRAGASGNPA